MTLFRNSAEGGTPGVAATANNSGANSGNAWSQVATGSGAQMLYDKDTKAHGVQSYLLRPPSGSTSGFAYGMVSFAATDRAGVSFYMRPTTASDLRSIVAIRHASGNVAQVRLTTGNVLQVTNATGSQVFLASAPLVPYRWYRIEIRAVRGSGSSDGTIEFAYYAQDDSATPVETFSSTSENTGTNDITGVRVGHNVVGFTGTFSPFWIDSIQVTSDSDADALPGAWKYGTLRPWRPTTAQILNLEGVRRRVDRFRFVVCDRDLNPIGELHPDKSQGVPTIRMDADGQTPNRRLSGLTLTPSEAADINPITDRLRVYMQLQNGAEFLLGTFVFTDESRPVRGWGTQATYELTDYSFVLEQGMTKAYSWNKGGTITLIMFFLLFQAGFEVSDVAVIGEEANRGLADAVAWEPGSTWSQALTDLGTPVGFGPPYFDRYGRVHLEGVPDPEKSTPSVPAYGPRRILADSIVRTNDMLSAPNEFAVFDSGTDRLRIGRYELPASAPHSFQKRGIRIGASESSQGSQTQAQLNAAARNLARESDVYETVQFSSPLDPRHDVYDIVEFDGVKWLETSWSMELRSGGTMQHTLKRVHYDVV